MLNHARTLLMNHQGPHDEVPAQKGDVYISTYTPIDFTDLLAGMRTVLFGTDPNYEGLLYRMAQYMAILHSTEYEAYLYTSDSRITYDPLAQDIMDIEFGASVQTTSSQDLVVTGTWDDDDTTCRTEFDWRVNALAGNDVRVTNLTTGEISVQDVYVGIPLILSGSTLTFFIEGTALTAGDRWFVTYKPRPQPDLGVVVSNLQDMMSPALVEELFGSPEEGLVEPYLTYYNLFTQHYAMQYQLSGALLALIDRTQEIIDGDLYV